MALTLEQYATYLDTRHDLPWPAAPEVDRPRAKPHLVRLPEVRAVLWNVYGTLLAIPTGDLVFEHPTPFIMNNALDKTIQEFKMWASMSRKPGQPSEYLGQIYRPDPHRAAPRTRRRGTSPRGRRRARLGSDPQAPPPEGLQVRRRIFRSAQRV